MVFIGFSARYCYSGSLLFPFSFFWPSLCIVLSAKFAYQCKGVLYVCQLSAYYAMLIFLTSKFLDKVLHFAG